MKQKKKTTLLKCTKKTRFIKPLYAFKILFLFMCMYAHMCAGVHRGQEEALKIPWSWSIGSCKPPGVGAGN